jgi:hypothetical protein
MSKTKSPKQRREQLRRILDRMTVKMLDESWARARKRLDKLVKRHAA